MSKFIRKKRNSESWFRYFSSVSHLWLGLLSSIVIFTTSFSGSIYAFKTQIENVINNASIYNTSVTNTSKSNLDNMMDAFENRYSKATSITLFKDSTRSVLISSATRNIDGTSAYYDAVTHKNLGNKNETSIAFFKIVLDVHRNILMGDFGKKINGTAVLIFIYLLFSGFVIWLPKKISQLKNNLSIKWNARFFRLNFDLHRLLGLYSLLLLFIISSTGVYVSALSV
ncbi:PepSY-associated TM helix domain-containing protein [uncultured Cytophaga sp.]|uniref:PepSY-associated TM helix domain-containing protein n=1 Tax=uncultured Cytophaga sp. TaxID=160238 RepID=UPI00263906CB|nr:PepSY-associated TM helix domain-containing protein [uncultured Cytophaga sp.]